MSDTSFKADKKNSTINNAAFKLGLVVNSFAGLGGAAALKGSDGDDIQSKALNYHHNQLRAPARVERFIKALQQAMAEQSFNDNIEWFSAAGLLGGDTLSNCNIKPRLLNLLEHEACRKTTAAETKKTVEYLLQQQVDLIVFAGGDGTARDILDVLESNKSTLPCLGIPAGVKMQSGVFALSPEAAANIIINMLATDLVSFSEQDVRDIDEAALRENKLRSQYYGAMLVPSEPHFLQHVKQGGVEDEQLVLDEIGDYLAEIMHDSGKLMIIGPGKTTATFMQQLGLKNTLVGFDAVLEGKLIQSDLTADDLLQLHNQYTDLLLVISPTGQQGMLIGRGNQQLSTEFLAQLNKEQWLIVATKTKLAALNKKPLVVDSNDTALDQKLCGLYSVITGFNDRVLYPVNISYQPLTH